MIPLFRVNDEIDRDELRWQIRSIKEQGCGGVFSILERFNEAAPQRFLSGWWWNVVDWMAEACQEEGLEFWVYDDEDWPSGSIGGQLLENNPDFNWKYLTHSRHSVSGGTVVELEVGDGKFVAATVHGAADQIDVDSIKDISDCVQEGKLTWIAPSGPWIITVYTALPGKGFFVDGYGDLMSREAMATFVDQVYKGHYDHLKNKGRNIAGFFTDEPGMSYAMIEWGERFFWYPSMPWTSELGDAFIKQHGYDFKSRLPLLYEDNGKDSLSFRCHYWETCCNLYSKNYFKQIYDFCEERGIKSSGHLVVEEKFTNHLAQQGGNIVQHYRYMHVPGIDWIHPFESFEHLPSTTPKYATSMAHLMNRPRTWCESFAATGLGTTFQDYRRIVNWEHVNGINMQIPITYKYSMKGRGRATFYCPGLSYQQPFWDHLHEFSNYEARVCSLLSGGGHVAQVVLAYPSVDIWSHCWDHKLLDERSITFNNLGDSIRRAGYDYDILDDEAILRFATIEEGILKTDTENFKILIFPHTDAMRRETLDAAVELVRSGGLVIFVGNIPTDSYETGSNDAELAQTFMELFGSYIARAQKGEVFWTAYNKGQVGFAPSVEQAVNLLQEALPPDFNAHGSPEVFSYRRKLNDGNFYFVFNNLPEQRNVSASFSAEGYPEEWNTMNGSISALNQGNKLNGNQLLSFVLYPYELKVIFLRDAPGSHPVAKERRVVSETTINGPFPFTPEFTMDRENVAWNFPPDHNGWTAKEPKQTEQPDELMPGDWSAQGYEFFSGIGHYSFAINLEIEPVGDEIIELDLGDVAVSASVTVNSLNAGTLVFNPYNLDITSFVKQGTNKIEVSVANTLSNFFSQFKELDDQPLNLGGDMPERRVSGLLGPVVLRVLR